MQISVLGSHTVSRAPERATVRLGLSFESTDKIQPIAALRQAVTQLDADLARLRAAAPSPITWSAISAPSTRSWRPWHDDPRDGQPEDRPLRHAASVTAQVKFRDFPALAVEVAAWAERPGWTVERVEWTLTDATHAELADGVLAAAVDDAQHRAEVLAAAAGAGAVRVIEIADPGLLGDGTPQGAGPRLMSRALASSQDDGLVIAPEDVELSAHVHVRFEA